MVGEVKWKIVKGLPQYSISSDGYVRNNRSHKKLKYRLTKKGYARISLGAGNDSYVHRLVAEYFICPDPSTESIRYAVNHKDGIKTNNTASNLEWVTYKENTQHALRSGLILTGENHQSAKLSQTDVDKIKILLEHGVDHYTIADAFGVSQGNISNIGREKSWRNAT